MKSPGHESHPDHKVVEVPVTGKLRVQVGADVFAESTDVIEVIEDRNPPRYYFPREDVRMDTLTRSDTHTHCAFKGDASYFSLTFGDGKVIDAAWTYETPYDEHRALAGRIAFWSEKFEDMQFKKS